MKKIFFGFYLLLLLLSDHVLAQGLHPIVGAWAMFKDKHPDGWGNFHTPYYYYRFNEDSTFNRFYLGRSDQTVVFGKYEMLGDSLIVFHESTATNGRQVAFEGQDTVRVFGIHNGKLEIHEHWYTLLRGRRRPFKHRKYFRPTTDTEQRRLERIYTRIMNDFTKLDLSKFRIE